MVLAALILACTLGPPEDGGPARVEGSSAMLWLPWLGTFMGPRWDVTPRDRVRYRLDVELGALGVFKETAPAKRLTLLPTVGYGLDQHGSERPADHLLLAGLGLGWGMAGGVAVRPRVVYGGNLEGAGVGMRMGVMGFVAGGAVTLELSHQVLWFDGQPRHSLGLHAGVNVGGVVYLVTLIGKWKRGFRSRRSS